MPIRPINQGEIETINNLSKLINSWAETKGWNEAPLDDLSFIPEDVRDRIILSAKAEKIALIHSELSECLEALRNGVTTGSHSEVSELADVLIRIFHYSGQYNLPLGKALAEKHDFNTQRSYKHGGKKF